MAAPVFKPRMSVAEYLEFERDSETRHEFFRGELFAMAGASPNHNDLVSNIAAGLHNQFRGKPCRARMNDMRVQTAENGLYAYPDVVVGCDPIEYAPGDSMTMTNPILLVEVLSNSTELRDRTFKFDNYCLIASVQEIVFVAQDCMRVERYRRDESGWHIRVFLQLEDEVDLASCGCKLGLKDIYERIEFPSSEPAEDSDQAAG